MFTTPAPAAPTLSATTVSSTSPVSRPSRLRDLSASLRHYTHSLHSHSSATVPVNGTGSSSTSTSSRADTRRVQPPESQTTKRHGRPRAASASPLITTPPLATPASATTATTASSIQSPTAASATSSASQEEVEVDRALSRTFTAPEPLLSSHQQAPRSETSQSASALPSSSIPTIMTRSRAETAAPQLTVRNQSGPTPASTPTPTPPISSAMDAAEGTSEGASSRHLPSIRFIPHQDPRAARPSLQFPTMQRTLPDETAVIRVGRYSERDNLPDIPPSVPSAAAVGFKSKVVSRKHCELWCKDSQWYIKDVKSSSGTFLNHIRLSQPNVESKPFKLKDGDIIQLGIDFRGGEEMIFRCVKIRVECNRGWQQALNTFNKQTHQRLRNLAKNKKESDSASTHTSECAICLMSIAPCQSLFVAPCSHVWHYKCIRPILNGPTWPNFLCPNCRAVADLEADVEDMGEFEEWDEDVVQANSEPQPNGTEPAEDKHVTPRDSAVPLANDAPSNAQSNVQFTLGDLEAVLSNMDITRETTNGTANQATPAPSTPHRFISPPGSSSVTQPVVFNSISHNESPGLSPLFQRDANGLSPDRVPDGPMTPRNDAGPFVLDGSGGRTREESPNPSNSGAPSIPPLHMN